MRRQQLDSPLLAIVVEGFLSRLSFGLITFALPLYAHRMGLSLGEVGFLISLELIVGVVLKPAVGRMGDRFGLKRGLTVAIGMRSLVAVLLALAGSPWHLYAIRSAHGLSKAVRDPAVNALIVEHGGTKTMASAFAWYQTAKTVAGAVGKALAGFLLTLTASNFSLVFLIASLLSALPLWVVARFVHERSQPQDALREKAGKVPMNPDDQEVQPSGQATAARPAIGPFVGLGFLVTGTAEMLHGLFPILATKYMGLSEAEAGLLYVASTLVLLAGPFFGWLSDNVGQRLVLMVRGSTSILSSLIYVAAPNLPGLAAGRVLDDVGKAAFRPAWGALMAHLSRLDKRHRVQTVSLLSMGEDAGEILGPILAGLLWNAWGLTAMLCTRALLAVVSEAYTALLMKSLERGRPLGRAREGVCEGELSHS